MEHILLLHGAIGSKEQLQPLKVLLEKDFTVHAIHFSGHGGQRADRNFSIPSFATQVQQYIQQNGLPAIHIFGYSMGGYVALHLARHQPGLVKSIITLATKFFWDEATACKEVKMLDAEKIEEKLPAFAALLQLRHTPGNWKEVLNKTREMLIAMGQSNPLQADDYSKIEIPVLIMLGDRDKMVSLEETVATYHSLPNAQMAVMPCTSHPIEQVDMAQLSFQIKNFISKFS